MTTLLRSLLIFGAICAGWYWFEGRWDRRLFARRPGAACSNLRPRAAARLFEQHPDLLVIDVRSPAEFAGGTLPDAVNFPLGDPSFRQRVAALDRTRPLLVYCAGGFRSRKAVEVLRALDFRSIHHLHRGYHSWRWAGLPIGRPGIH